MKGIFIVGVDTDAGKTIVGMALGIWLKKKGLPIRVIKPFETGCIKVKGRLLPLDGSFYKLLLGLDEPVEEIVPFRFSKPLAPYQASLIDGRPIEYAEALRFLSQRLDDSLFYLLEGAGGLFVPLEERNFLIHLIRDLGFPTLVVAANRLGVINHTLLTLEALESHRIENLGVILSEKEKTADPVKSLNREYFQTILGGRYLGELPFVPSVAELAQVWPKMVRQQETPDQEWLRRLQERLGRAFGRHIAGERLLEQVSL